MNQDLSHLSLTELYDRLSESTAQYSKSMLKGLSEKDFKALRATIEQLQREISKRKKQAGNNDNSRDIFPPEQSATA